MLRGRRLVAISGAYGADGTEYRTEVDSFARILSHGTAGTGPAWFEVHTKSGQAMEFGRTADSQILAQGKATARSWALNKISDSKANYFTVTYVNDNANGQAYPSRIDYTGNTSAGLAPNNSVQFVYATRPDISPQYQAGSLMRTTVRLTDVKTFTGSTLVADYRLAYQQTAAINRTLLASVTVCDAANNCLPATSFIWADADGLQFSTPVSWSAPGNFGGLTATSGDVNGDGRLDMILSVADASSWRAWVALGQGDGTFAAPVSWSVPGSWGGWTATSGDVNGDGRLDMILSVADASSWRAWVALGQGDGTFAAPVSWSVPGSWGGWTATSGDVNGDGRLDMILSVADASSWRAWVALGRGDGTFAAPVSWSVPGSWGGWTATSGDVNGDGRLDMILSVADASSWRAWVALGRGDGTFAAPVSWSVPGSWGGWTATSGDVNGDGRLDMILSVADASSWRAWVALGRGDGTFAAPVSWSVPGSWGGWTATSGDVNGDGRLDMILSVADASSWRAWVALGRGDGTFAAPASWSTSGSWGGWTPTSGDVNGDGRLDMILSVADASSWRAWVVQNSSASPKTTAIRAIVSGLGVTTTTSYQPLAGGSVYTKDNTSTYPIQDTQAPIYVVSSVSISDGVGGTRSWTYTYAGAKIDLSGGAVPRLPSDDGDGSADRHRQDHHLSPGFPLHCRGCFGGNGRGHANAKSGHQYPAVSQCERGSDAECAKPHKRAVSGLGIAEHHRQFGPRWHGVAVCDHELPVRQL